MNELFLIFPLVVFAVRIFQELLLQIIIMALFTRTNICFCVWKEVVWTEGEQIEFADVCLVKVVSCSKADKERLVTIFPHELIKLLADVIHYELL